jgi:hypothetical protein
MKSSLSRKTTTKKIAHDDKKRASPGTVKPKATIQNAAEKPFGRPTEYRPEYCQMLVDYFNIEVERVEELAIPDAKAEGGQRIERKVVINRYPTFERFAANIGVTRQTLHNWATDTHSDGTPVHPDFFYSYTRAKDLMAALLIEGGIAGTYDSRFASFAAKNLIGWRDQIDQHIEQNITTTPIEELDRVYGEAMAKALEQKEAVIQRRKLLFQGEKK